MVQFHIQSDSEIPASTQLFNQIRFAIAEFGRVGNGDAGQDRRSRTQLAG